MGSRLGAFYWLIWRNKTSTGIWGNKLSTVSYDTAFFYPCNRETCASEMFLRAAPPARAWTCLPSMTRATEEPIRSTPSTSAGVKGSLELSGAARQRRKGGESSFPRLLFRERKLPAKRGVPKRRSLYLSTKSSPLLRKKLSWLLTNKQRRATMEEQSLDHTRWNCKYHIVLPPSSDVR